MGQKKNRDVKKAQDWTKVQPREEADRRIINYYYDKPILTYKGYDLYLRYKGSEEPTRMFAKGKDVFTIGNLWFCDSAVNIKAMIDMLTRETETTADFTSGGLKGKNE